MPHSYFIINSYFHCSGMENKKIKRFISCFIQDQFLNVNYISIGTDRMGDQNETEQNNF